MPPQEPCRQFYYRVEEIRERKMSEALSGNRTDKNFTQAELSNRSYSTYIGMGKGDIKYPPPRDIVDAIADYLEVHQFERNELLKLAGHVGHRVIASDVERKALEKEASRFLNNFTNMPAFLIDEKWDIILYNQQAISLFETSEEDIEKLRKADIFNILEFILNPDLNGEALTGYSKFGNDSEEQYEVICRNIMGWKFENYLYSEHSWYKEFEKQIKRHYLARKLWDSVKVETQTETQTSYITPYSRNDGQKLRLFSLFTFFGDYHYPHLTTFYPDDQDTAALFKKLKFGGPISFEL